MVERSQVSPAEHRSRRLGRSPFTGKDMESAPHAGAPSATASTLNKLISDIKKGIPTPRLKTLITSENAKAADENGPFLACVDAFPGRIARNYFPYNH
jgi:hypothetical protein